jgi:YNFM family putative membrane transporter
MRALAGLTLGGVPAGAMAYLSEEMHAKAIGLAMGLYISGNALGGMSGRLVTGAVTDGLPVLMSLLESLDDAVESLAFRNKNPHSTRRIDWD